MTVSYKNSCSYIPQRWVTVLMSFLGLFNAYAMRICLSIAITQMTVPSNETIEYKDDTCSKNSVSRSYVPSNFNATLEVASRGTFEWSEYTQGIILSSFYWGYIVTNLFGGAIAQRFGGRHTLGLGILSTAIFTLLTPVCVNWGDSTALICLRVLMGFGEGTTYPAVNDLLAKWVPEDERSKAGSVAYSGVPLGTIFGMTVSGVIMQHSDIGWPAVFYFFGILGVASFFVNLALCYSKPSNNPFISEKEASYLQEKLVNIHKDIPSTPWKHILLSPPVWALIALTTGNAWGFLTISSDMPKYMSSVLKFSVEDNGYFSSVPYLCMWLSSIVTSCIADWFIAKKKVPIGKVRKIGSTIASLGPATFLILASYAGCDGFLVIVLLTVGLTLNGCAMFSLLINALDIGPNYAGSLMGLINGVSTLGGILSPYIVGIITPNQTLTEWRIVFWIVFGFFVISNTIFLIYGSGEVQKWNNPTFLKRKDKADHTEIEPSIQLMSLERY